MATRQRVAGGRTVTVPETGDRVRVGLVASESYGGNYGSAHVLGRLRLSNEVHLANTADLEVISAWVYNDGAAMQVNTKLGSVFYSLNAGMAPVVLAPVDDTVTAPRVAYPDPDVEFAHHRLPARFAIELAREMPDRLVLSAIRDGGTEAEDRMRAHVGRGADRSWILATLAEIAYDRGLISESELAVHTT